MGINIKFILNIIDEINIIDESLFIFSDLHVEVKKRQFMTFNLVKKYLMQKMIEIKSYKKG